MKAYMIIFEKIGEEYSEERVKEYEACGYLTINDGRDGQEYAWYADEHFSVAVNVRTLEVLTEDQIEELLA